MTFRSTQFDDIYFSPEDGLAETKHVFLRGNNLPEAWQNKDKFVIIEAGFGTGLNFMAAWTLFEQTARPDQRLHYVSFEKYPLAWDDMMRALSPWREAFGGRLDRLRALYPLRVPGFHRVMINEQVTLTLIFDDVNSALPQIDAPCGVDAWFLDGFAPAKNPEMWSETVFREMARLCNPGATFATFTVASAVRHRLAAAGFAAEKKKGFARKREMLAGHFMSSPGAALPRRPLPKGGGRVAIIGGGLAGTACAFVLKRYGLKPVIFEGADRLASGASGNALGLYNPRLSMNRTPEADFYTAGFAQAFRTLGELRRGYDIGFNPCGSLHLITDDDRQRKLRGAAQNWGWHKSHLHLMDAAAASHRAGVALAQEALYLPEAGTVNPAALCQVYAAGVDIRLNKKTMPDDLKEFDTVILACGAAAKEFCDLPIHTVRGQITQVQANETTAGLRANFCFGGYLSTPVNGYHMLGATFQQWRDDTDVTDEDHADNIKRLAAVLPGAEKLEVTGGRAALRTSSKDRFPVIGHLRDNIYVSTAHGSHGIVSTLAGAHLIADMIGDGVRSQSRDVTRKLDAGRFRK